MKKKQSKSPCFQFYAGDYLADENVQVMTLEEEGAYIRALAYCWREGSIPADPALLSRLLKGASNQIVTTVQRCFNVSSRDATRLIHPRLERERRKQHEWAKKSQAGGVASGKARKEKKFQAEPTVNGGSNKVEPKSNSSFSFSSSFSSSSSEDKTNGKTSLSNVNSSEPQAPEIPADSDVAIFEIATAHPKLSHLRNGEVPNAVANAIIQAIEKDGRDLVLSGTRAYAESHPHFAIDPYKYFSQFTYRRQPDAAVSILDQI